MTEIQINGGLIADKVDWSRDHLDKLYESEVLARLASDAFSTRKLLECGVELCAERRRNAPFARDEFKDPYKNENAMQTVIAAEDMSTGQFLYCGKKVEINVGNVLPIQSIPEMFRNEPKGTGFGPNDYSHHVEIIYFYK